MLFFIKEDNRLAGYTTTLDEVPGENNPSYVAWYDIPIAPPFESIDDATERLEDAIGMVIENGQLIEPEPPPPEYVNKMTVLQFRNRFTTQEKTAIYSSTDINTKMFLDDLSTASFVDVTDPNTIAGVDYLISTGIVESGRRQELLAQIELTEDILSIQ